MNSTFRLAILTLPALLLSACQTLPSAAAQGSDEAYFAAGTEPFWSVKIQGGRLEFRSVGLGEFTEPSVTVTNTANGMRYQTQSLALEVDYAKCGNGMSDISYQHTVALTLNGSTFRGCGGGLMPASNLDGTKWRLVSLGTTKIPETWNAGATFEKGRFSGGIGCNRLGATYTIDGTAISFGPVFSTKMACDGPQGIVELKLVGLLGENARLSINKADQMIWTSTDGLKATFAPVSIERIEN